MSLADVWLHVVGFCLGLVMMGMTVWIGLILGGIS